MPTIVDLLTEDVRFTKSPSRPDDAVGAGDHPRCRDGAVIPPPGYLLWMTDQGMLGSEAADEVAS